MLNGGTSEGPSASMSKKPTLEEALKDASAGPRPLTLNQYKQRQIQQQQQKQLMMNGDPFEISQPLSTARVPEGVTQAASVVPIKKNTHLNIATDQEGFIKSWSSWYPYNMLTSGTKELKTVH